MHDTFFFKRRYAIYKIANVKRNVYRDIIQRIVPFINQTHSFESVFVKLLSMRHCFISVSAIIMYLQIIITCTAYFYMYIFTCLVHCTYNKRKRKKKKKLVRSAYVYNIYMYVYIMNVCICIYRYNRGHVIFY